MGDRQGRDEVELEAGAGNLAGFELAWPSKVIPRLGLNPKTASRVFFDPPVSSDGSENKMVDPWLLGCPRACDINLIVGKCYFSVTPCAPNSSPR